MLTSLALTLALALAPSPALGALVPDTITVESGVVGGLRDTESGVRSFKGVPFADTTGGANAFMPPVRRPAWSGTYDASAWGPGCYSSHHNPDVAGNQSLDCLNVNIFAPSGLAPGEAVPVMAFLYGGAYLEGDNQGPFGMYSGANYAAHERVAVVTIGYRLGAFGWASLGSGAGVTIRGNLGLMDQIAGLQWIQRNAAAFGGNASAVTVFGESAGAMSIGVLMTLPQAQGLFHRAIMESNVGGFVYKNASEAAVYGASWCQELNCSTAGGGCNEACVRAAPPSRIQDAWNTATGNVIDFLLTDLSHILDGLLGTGPVIDGEFMRAEPLSLVEGGQYWAAGMPVLMGSNTNEGETFIYDGVPALPNFLAIFAYIGMFGFDEVSASTPPPSAARRVPPRTRPHSRARAPAKSCSRSAQGARASAASTSTAPRA